MGHESKVAVRVPSIPARRAYELGPRSLIEFLHGRWRSIRPAGNAPSPAHRVITREAKVRMKPEHTSALALLLGTALLAGSRFIPASSPDYSRRWLIAAIGLMLLALGLWWLKQRYRPGFSPSLDALLEHALRVVIFGVFALIGLAGAFVFGDEIRGGLWFLPPTWNNVLGRFFFGVFGIVLGLMVVAAFVRLLRLVLQMIMGRGPR